MFERIPIPADQAGSHAVVIGPDNCSCPAVNGQIGIIRIQNTAAYADMHPTDNRGFAVAVVVSDIAVFAL